MKFTTIAAAIVAVAPVAFADNCKGGLNYCGQTLLNVGNYHDQIIQALREANEPTSDDWVRRSLFYCTGFQGGDIKFAQACGAHCTDGGAGNNDYCG
ncbi:hypothetical protein V2A60_002242 [Cordyceps javanica]|uniref:Uncharacterized protein n=1 Tax=Cordyceps javanica TaxID=43265 RepID=A0A545VHM3_9HYPO|nr:hypothetical protein IF1G_01169 [Cordyceps javanica]TQW12389.1 hypothetical protein IF2G_01120 [Cordyceps javanica]